MWVYKKATVFTFLYPVNAVVSVWLLVLFLTWTQWLHQFNVATANYYCFIWSNRFVLYSYEIKERCHSWNPASCDDWCNEKDTAEMNNGLSSKIKKFSAGNLNCTWSQTQIVVLQVNVLAFIPWMPENLLFKSTESLERVGGQMEVILFPLKNHLLLQFVSDSWGI